MITIYTLWQASWIIAGMWMCSKYAWMCIYEIKKPGDGEKYLRGELFHTKTPKKEMLIIEIIIKKIQLNMKIIKNFVKKIKNKNDL
jgi:hypothetical protein